MKKPTPKIQCDRDHDLSVEVSNFSQLYKKLNSSTNGNPFSYHKLQFYLILIVTKNSYQHFLDFNAYDLKKGSVLFIAENQIQHFTKKLKQAEGISIVFDKSYFDKTYFFLGNNNFYRLFNYHIEKPTLHEDEIGQNEFVDLAKNIYKEYNNPEKTNRTEILYSMLKILLLKAEVIKNIQTKRQIKIQWLEKFNRFKELVENEYMISRSSKHYADQLLISYKSLNNTVKQITSKTPKAFIDYYVTIEIKRYLISTSLSIKEISYKTGFEDPTNLINFFKRNVGTTPLKFRNQF